MRKPSSCEGRNSLGKLLNCFPVSKVPVPKGAWIPAAHLVLYPSNQPDAGHSQSQPGAGTCTLTPRVLHQPAAFNTWEPTAEPRALPSASLQPQQSFLLQKTTTNHRTQNKNPTHIYRIKWHRLKTSVFADAQSQASRESKAPHLLIPHTSKMIHSQPVNATSVLIFCKQTDCFWLKFLSFLHHKQNSHILLFLICCLVISL